MKPVTWESSLRWNDPNLRWGDPSYLLEPGDPGYTPPPGTPFAPKQTKKHKNMPKSDYIPQNDNEFATLLANFKNNIGSYPALALNPAKVAEQAADATYFAAIVADQEATSQAAQQWTAWRNLMRTGAGPSASTPPLAPVLSTPPATIPAPGIEGRFRALVNIIKPNPAYNEPMGQALGIEGPVQTAPDLSAVKPQLKVEMKGGQPFVRWGWQGNSAFLDMIELCVDRADGKGFVTLAYDTTPDYLDTAPMPANAAIWTYKGIYRVGDARVGQWSDPVSINVAG
jgi:hypothetical protein